MMPLFIILLGIIQFGFIFNAYVTITNASREGARLGTVYVYEPGMSKSQNDLARNNKIKTAVLGSMNLLTKTAPNFSTSSDLDAERHDLHEWRSRRGVLEPRRRP